MVPIYLGLIDGTFEPNNLQSAQESPAPLPKFQIAPRLKILMSFGSKKGTQIQFPFLSKSPGKQITSRFPSGAPMKRDTCLQGILHISRYISLSQRPLKKSIPPCSPKAGPLWKQTPILEPYLTYLSGSSVKEPSLQVPLLESPRTEMPCS